jgi:hypothetical protein
LRTDADVRGPVRPDASGKATSANPAVVWRPGALSGQARVRPTLDPRDLWGRKGGTRLGLRSGSPGCPPHTLPHGHSFGLPRTLTTNRNGWLRARPITNVTLPKRGRRTGTGACADSGPATFGEKRAALGTLRASSSATATGQLESPFHLSVVSGFSRTAAPADASRRSD